MGEISGTTAIRIEWTGISLDTWYYYDISYDASKTLAGLTGTLNGASFTSAIETGTFAGMKTGITASTFLYIGKRTNSNFFDGKIAGIVIEDGSNNVLASYSLAAGAGLIEYDRSGNGTDAVITATPSAFWANTQDLYHNNLLNGYSLYEHATSDPIFVPYGSNNQPLTITPPSGYTLTEDRPSGKWHNHCETKFLPNPDGIDPELIYRADIDGSVTRHNSDGFVVPEFMNNQDLAKSKDYVVYDKNITAEQAIIVNEAIKRSILTILSATVENALPNDWVIVFDEAVSLTSAGWTLKINGTPASITGTAGTGTNTITFTTTETPINGDVLTFDYDSSVGDCFGDSDNAPLNGVTGQAVTNNVV